jgi:hypothetical protein
VTVLLEYAITIWLVNYISHQLIIIYTTIGSKIAGDDSLRIARAPGYHGTCVVVTDHTRNDAFRDAISASDVRETSYI